MITKNIVKQQKSIVEITIAVPWTDLQANWDQTLQKVSADIELPGFRKGTAPISMVEQNLGQKLQDEVLKTAMPNFLIEALKGTDIVPIDYPKYDVISFSKGNNLQFKATITNRPQISVGDYKSIKAVRPNPKAVTDEDIIKVINDLFKRWQLKQAPVLTSEPSKTGQNQNTGSISFQASQQSAPNDEFAQAMGALSLIELKTKIKKDLESNSSYNNELDFEEAILQEVEKITTVEMPEILIQDELNRMLVSLQRRVADMGLLLEDYLKSQGKTLDQIKNEWRIQAEKNVRMELGLSEIARMENVTITDDELKAEIDKIQDQKIKAQFEAQEPRLHLRHALRQTRTLDLLKKMVGG